MQKVIPIKILLTFLLLVLFVLGIQNTLHSSDSGKQDANSLWIECRLEGIVTYEVFQLAINGYYQMNNLKKNNLLTIIDYSKPSNEKRFLVIDLGQKKLLYYCLVAHGKNSGDTCASQFSNQPNSHKSCLGKFLTAETYWGKHGYSMRLDGLEVGINSNARSRDIVIHGADYVSEQNIAKYGRIGRSWGCPALPVGWSKEIINTISNGSYLFIYGNGYVKNSGFVNL